MSTKQVLWSAAQAASATGGQAHGDWRAEGVSIDSRTLAPGDLFVALKGSNHDGHDHVTAALGGHAAAAMASPRSPISMASGQALRISRRIATGSS